MTAVEQLYGGGAHALGPLPFITEAMLARLVAEAHEAPPERPDEGRRIAAPAGAALARLTVSRHLRGAISGALGFPMAPTYDAV